jgi:transcriptional regulator GlxA family with amidase domain
VIGGEEDMLPALEHAELIAYVRHAGESAQWVAATSIGALLLAAAGLLEGRLAMTHWAYADRLEAYGARSQPAESTNWVTDGKFTTAAGVSGAIDMALGLGATMTNQAAAQSAQLQIEYDPHPPLGRLDYKQPHGSLLYRKGPPLDPPGEVKRHQCVKEGRVTVHS